MVLSSDLSLNASKFRSDAISQQTHNFNKEVIKMIEQTPNWWEVGAPEHRELRRIGKTEKPARIVLQSGRNIQIQSRDASRDILCRVFSPPSTKPAATVMHIHGGGWVLQSHEDYDPLINRMAEEGNLAVVSVGYRLAPEHPFPAGPEDCYDAAEWLAANSEHHFGAPFKFIMGDSAGSHLSVLSALHLLSTPQSYFGIKGLVLHYGLYDVAGLPSNVNLRSSPALPTDTLNRCIEAFVPQIKEDPTFARRPDLSPFYADLSKFKGRIPPALFTCSTNDPLIDDSVFMGVKWMTTGAETYVKLYPGELHGFLDFPPDVCPAADEAVRVVLDFTKKFA